MKSIYRAIPFKKQIFTVIRKIARPPRSLYKHLYFKGKFRVRLDQKKNSSFLIMHHGFEIENEIFWNGAGGWEKFSQELWMRLCENAKVILDIGANTGVYSFVAK
jgi:hypothetical protein